MYQKLIGKNFNDLLIDLLLFDHLDTTDNFTRSSFQGFLTNQFDVSVWIHAFTYYSVLWKKMFRDKWKESGRQKEVWRVWAERSRTKSTCWLSSAYDSLLSTCPPALVDSCDELPPVIWDNLFKSSVLIWNTNQTIPLFLFSIPRFGLNCFVVAMHGEFILEE